MTLRSVLGVLLLAAGTLALVHRGFTWTRASHDARIGRLEFAIKKKERIEVPVRAGVSLVAAGGVLLLWASRRRA
ncbi:MAG: hypothetical protein ACRD6R_10550 [Candidatus Polarisedimenticolia bacterium]